MILIFIASADPDSGPRGSRLLAPLLRWLVPDLSPEVLEHIVLFVRKVAHFGTFGILAVLIWRALTAARSTRAWSWRTAGWALAATAGYAATDEFHQLFVPTRVGALSDVGIDTLGAAFALGCVRLGHGFYHHRR